MKPVDSLILSDERLAVRGESHVTVAGLAHHQDEVRPGTLFFAVAGTRFDGHFHAAEALEKGAVTAVVERDEIFRALPKAILVRSTREALAVAASRWLDEPSRFFKLVGVTGTNGKTTTSYLLKHMWDTAGVTSGIVGTVEYHIGAHRESSLLTTPDPVGLQGLFQRMRIAGATFAAIEVSSIALDQYRVAGSRFDVGVFTNLTQDHLDYHGDMARYFEAKLRLFREYDLPIAVINVDDPWGKKLFAAASSPVKLSFSVDKSADFSVRHLDLGKSGTRALVATPQGDLEVTSPLIGKHNLYNVLAVLGAAHGLGMDLKQAARALATGAGAPGRLERVPLGEGAPHVFVDYAHSDDALRNVLQSLSGLRAEAGARIITVFGCGGDRDRGKRPRMAAVVSELSDITVATSDNPRTEDPERILDDLEAGIAKDSTRYHREADRRKAIALALSLARPGDLVLIAGKGHESYQILGREKVPFDDRAVAQETFVPPHP